MSKRRSIRPRVQYLTPGFERLDFRDSFAPFEYGCLSLSSSRMSFIYLASQSPRRRQLLEQLGHDVSGFEMRGPV